MENFNYSAIGNRLTGAMPVVPSGNVATVRMRFIFSPDWNGLTKHAVFKKCGKSYDASIENGVMYMPTEIMKKPGAFDFGVVGYESDGETVVERISTNMVGGRVIDGAYNANAENGDAEDHPSDWEKLMEHLSDTSNPHKVKSEQLEEDPIFRGNATFFGDVDTMGGVSALRGEFGIAEVQNVDDTNEKAVPNLSTVRGMIPSLPTVDAAMSDTSRNAVENRVIKAYVDAMTPEGIVDTEMSDTSTNPVENRVIKAYVDKSVGDIVTENVITPTDARSILLTIDGDDRSQIKSNGTISITPGYKTFFVFFKDSTEIWFDTPNKYCSLARYSGTPFGVSTFISPRYVHTLDGSTDELPKKDAPMQIGAGTYIAMTVTYAGGSYTIHESGNVSINGELLDQKTKVMLNMARRINSSMKFAAHRGAEYYAPENSLPAYDIAGKMGFSWAWLAQVRHSSDGELYVIHDEDLNRTTDVADKTAPNYISDYTSEQLASVNVDYLPSNRGFEQYEFAGMDMHIPKLEEVIRVCKLYGMKMCFRFGSSIKRAGSSAYDFDTGMPPDVSTESRAAIYERFVNLLIKYNVQPDECCFSGTPQQLHALYTKLSSKAPSIAEKAEASAYMNENKGTALAERIKQLFTDYQIYSAIVPLSNLDYSESDVQHDAVEELHANGIKVYAYQSAYADTQQDIVKTLAMRGVEIFQNSSVPGVIL